MRDHEHDNNNNIIIIIVIINNNNNNNNKCLRTRPPTPHSDPGPGEACTVAAGPREIHDCIP